MSGKIFDGFIPIVKRTGTICIASFPEIPEISASSISSSDAVTKLKIKWEEYKKTLKEKQLEVPVPLSKKEYSGQFNVRLDSTLHKALVQEAARKEISLNALIVKKLKETTAKEISSLRWDLTEVKFWAEMQAFLLFFKSANKKELILKIYKTILEDSLGDANVKSEDVLFRYIRERETLLCPLNQFLSENVSTGKFNKNDIIECILVSKRDFKEKMHYSQNSTKEFENEDDFYIYQVCA